MNGVDGVNGVDGRGSYRLKRWLSAGFEAEVEALDGMGEGTDADEIDTLLGVVADSVVGYASRRLHLIAVVDDGHGLARVGGGEIVEHDAVYPTLVEDLLELVEVADLNLNLQVEALSLEIFVAAADGVDDASGEVDVVVLEENHVEESYTVVHPASNLHGLLLEDSHSRSRLSGVEDMASRSGYALYVAVCHRSYSAHTLHDIQHQPFRL